MQTETHILGDTQPIAIALSQPDRIPVDLSDCTVALKIRRAHSCVAIPGAIPDPIWGEVVFDLANRSFAPNVYRARVEVTWSDGRTETVGEFALNIKEVC